LHLAAEDCQDIGVSEMLRIECHKLAISLAAIVCVSSGIASGQTCSQPGQPPAVFEQASWGKPLPSHSYYESLWLPEGEGQENGSQGSGSAGESGGSSGGGASAADATNPTAAIKVFQVQNSFVPNTYEASGYSNVFSLQAVLPFKTRSEFFPTWITRTTLPVISTADPDGSIPIGPGNDTDFDIPLFSQAGLGDLVFISLFNHPTDWGSWGIGPGFVAPSATRAELGEQSWKFTPTFAVINTSKKDWTLGILGMYNFPLDARGSRSFQIQPLIVKQLGKGWYTGWGDDLWSFNSESGNFAMPLQLRLGRVKKIRDKNYNIAVTGIYTPEDLHRGPAPEWGIKFSIGRLLPASK